MLGITSEPLSQNLLESHLTVSTCPLFTEASQSQMFFTAYEMFEGHRTRKSMWFSPSRPGGTSFFFFFYACNLHGLHVFTISSSALVQPNYKHSPNMSQKQLCDHHIFMLF